MNEIRFDHVKVPIGIKYPYVFQIASGHSFANQNHDWPEVYRWCKQEVGAEGKDFDYSALRFYFKRIDHAFKFKMRWC